jgi:hypothetical protein
MLNLISKDVNYKASVVYGKHKIIFDIKELSNVFKYKI